MNPHCPMHLPSSWVSYASFLLAALLLGLAPWAQASSTKLLNGMAAGPHASAVKSPEPSASAALKDEPSPPPIVNIKSAVAKQLKDAIEASNAANGKKKKPTVVVTSTDAAATEHGASAAAKAPGGARPRRAVSKTAAAHAATQGHSAGHNAAHWSYEGETGPQAWAQLQPTFNLCAIGKRQSPIHIEESAALVGPAEPLQIHYQPSKGTVVNNGHTIQVDLETENTLTVRGSVYKLVQFHFHHPAEEKLNYKGFAMVAHLVHKNAEGQLAVLALLFDPGEPSSTIEKVWTYMPLDVNDRVRLPDDLIDLNDALPKDRRYYQFIGSLTTPPCTEGVLWLVLKTPVTLSRDQLKLFARLFPNNARPIQPNFGRVIREAL